MPATDSEPTSMEGPHVLEDGAGSLTTIPPSLPPVAAPSSAPLVLTATRPDFASQNEIETKAVSMASNDSSSALSSPAEASPAKPAVTPPTTFNGPTELSPATSRIASASDSLACTRTSLVSTTESLPLLPTTVFGSSSEGADFPTSLTFKGVTVTLENNKVWKQFHSCGTEMILTKHGRRMFPYCKYRLSGLEPTRKYNLVLSIVPSDQYRYRWNASKWEVSGEAEHQNQGLIRAFSHHCSPSLGSEWMKCLLSFYKLKLTNNWQDQEGHIILRSMHRYIPRLHVIPVLEADMPTPDKPVVMGAECMTFTFPQMEFMAVTTYQNFRITQLKINYNPFAKGFREDGNNPRLNRILPGAQHVENSAAEPAALTPAEIKEEDEDLSIGNHTAAVTPPQVTRLVLKPIMSTTAGKNEPYVPCIRGKHALGELVLVQERPCVKPKEETNDVSKTPEAQRGCKAAPAAASVTPSSRASTPGSSPRYHKKKKRINRRWANSRGRDWKAAAPSPRVVHSPSLTVAMQPELDDVEGLLFVSFISKEALEVHSRDKPANNSSSASPVPLTTQTESTQTVAAAPETDEEKMARFKAALLRDLSALRHRQVIHPLLQEVGLKLSSLDPNKPIDLQYLGVHLPLPLPNLPEQGSVTSPGDEGLPFISRTGKTSDMTKIKGWKNKFIRSKETTSSNCDGSQKNLSAFCSNMLDEYLESEAQNITDRAAAFSTNPEGSVAYQLPAKSSSYVKTLDSVLKQRSAASKFWAASNRPCPLSHKPPLSSALSSQTGAPAIQRPAPSGSKGTNSVHQKPSTNQPQVSHKPTMSFGQCQVVTSRPSSIMKLQSKLLQMETGALKQGLARTHLTPDRLEVALSVMLTKEMQPNQVLKVPQHQKNKAEGPECGQEFCTLGCVCSSLRYLNRGPLHCQRPECMFGCACFKSKITRAVGETDQLSQPVYSMKNMDHAAQPRWGPHVAKLWNRNIHDVDSDPVFVPERAPLPVVPIRAVKRSSLSHPAQMIREEDKDPVYKYFESMMTCARVREFNSKPAPVVPIEPKIVTTSTPNTSVKTEKKTTDDLPKMYYRTVLKKAENTPQGKTSKENEARKQIEIQSACNWDKDRKKVLEALCRRLSQNNISRRFFIGPYRIRPVAKICMRKPSGSLITYRLHISKPSDASGDDERESEDSDEERCAEKSMDGDSDAEGSDGQSEEPVIRCGVTPFLTGAIPAGKLRARPKPAGCQAYGLIQVNGKSYNQARLLLGNMGSLHPANRLAAYVTGRLNAPADFSQKASHKSDPANKIKAPGALHLKAAGSLVLSPVSARKTTELKTSMQPLDQLSRSDFLKKEFITLLQPSPISSTVHPFLSGQPGAISALQSSSVTSPVSLTVSPSLKTPSFLRQSGTYSFRICPPSNEGAKGPNGPGVVLPGGFTLIQLPKHGADGSAQQQSDSATATNTASVTKPWSPNWNGVDALLRAKALLNTKAGELVSTPELIKKEPSIRPVDSKLDTTSEGSGTESSDFYGDGEDDEDLVDIETVEEVRHGALFNKVLKTDPSALTELGGSSKSVPDLQDYSAVQKRKQHTVLERQRRYEQRHLFDKLHATLQSDPSTPTHRVLTQAIEEIQSLVETSKYLEEQKRRLTQIQTVYVKKLSVLSGKSDVMIKQKLKEIHERHKMREKAKKWTPFFSHLLQSRAALLQGSNPQSKVKTMPLLEPDFFVPSYQAKPEVNTAQKKADQTLAPKPHPLPVMVLSPVQAEVKAPSSQIQSKSGEPTTPAQVSVVISQKKCQPQGPYDKTPSQAPAAQDGSSPKPLVANAKNLSGEPPKHLTLPLIRSKTGRIILPSSLKPLNQGFFTLMVMNNKQKGENCQGEQNKQKGENCQGDQQPSDLDSSKNTGGSSLLKSDHASESRLDFKNCKTGQSSNSNLSLSSLKRPLIKIAPITSSDQIRQKDAVNSSSARRGRGRPRKRALTPDPTPVPEKESPDVEEDSSESETSTMLKEKQNKKIILEVAKDTPAVLTAKRGRGRPPKKKQETRSLPASGAVSSPSQSNEDSPTLRSQKAPKTASLHVDTSRPLTRGALGKDFPSAKKRSWIDIEKELGLECE